MHEEAVVPDNNLPQLSLSLRDWDGTAPDPLAHPEYYDGVVWRRVLAYAIDVVVLAAILVVAKMTFWAAGVVSLGLLIGPLTLAYALIPLAYHTYFIGGPRSATLGMRAMLVEVRAWTGHRPNYLQAGVQTILFYTTVTLTGGLVLAVVLFNERRRTLHDYLAGTVVIRSGAVAELPPPGG